MSLSIRFENLTGEYLADLHRRHPLLASASGIHDWEHCLEDLSRSALEDEADSVKTFERQFDEIPAEDLSPADRIDYRILRSNMRARLLEIESIRSHESNPLIYCLTVSVGLLRIALFDYAPPPTRLTHVVSKLAQVERLLQSAKSNIRRMPAVFLNVALKNLEGAVRFISSDLPGAFSGVGDEELRIAYRKTTGEAVASLGSYIEHLKQVGPDPESGFALGPDKFSRKLRFEEGIDVPVQLLHELAIRELERTRLEFQKTAERIDPGSDPIEVWRRIQADQPAPGTLVQHVSRQLEELERFVEEKNLVTIPEAPRPEVSATPDFMRWSGASLWMPGPFETGSMPARYMITDVDESWSERQKSEHLAAMNRSRLWSTSIHEAYPGHFVQIAYLDQVESIVRRTWALAHMTFVEGWAHYAEQLMVEQGFGENDPAIRMAQLADALLRLCRFVVCIREHTAGMTVDQAVRFFVENAYIGQTPARSEAERGTFDPVYLSYSLGKLALLKLRADWREQHGDGFSLREFHDSLLRNGLVPLWAHRELLIPGNNGGLLG